MGFFDKNAPMQPVNEFDMQLGALEGRKNELTFAIGRMFVESNDEASTEGTQYADAIKELKIIANEMINVEKHKLASQGLRKCEKCSNILVIDSMFCNKCGEKLEPLFPAAPEPAPAPVMAPGVAPAAPTNCPQCGAPLADGAAFCTNCGFKL